MHQWPVRVFTEAGGKPQPQSVPHRERSAAMAHRLSPPSDPLSGPRDLVLKLSTLVALSTSVGKLSRFKLPLPKQFW